MCNNNKRNYYLKISDDNFFMNPVVKKVHREYGAEGVLIYEQLLLKAAKNPESVLVYTGLEDDFKQEFSMMVTLGPDVELTSSLIDFLIEKGLLITIEPDKYFFKALPDMVGSISDSAVRMRESRKRKREASQGNGKVSQSDNYVSQSDVIKEIDIKKDIDTKKSIDNRSSPDKSGSPFIYPYQEVIEYLNLKAGTSFRSSSKDTQKHIRARFNDGYSIEDFKRVIDNKVSEWANDPEMSKFLRPSTLFGTKFESYLNQKSIKHRDRNRFNNFHQREYDFEDLENRLLNTDETSVHEDEPP